LNHLLIRTDTKCSIVSAFYGISWGHHFSGFESPTYNPFCQQLVFEGCQSLIVTETKKKELMKTEILKELFSVYDSPSSSLLDKRFLITCLSGFAGFFRMSELLEVKMKHIRIMDSHIIWYGNHC